MRTLRIALLALVSLSVLDASSAFARGNGAPGGTSGGTSGGSTGGSTGAGTGSTPLTYYVIPRHGPNDRHPQIRVVRSKVFSSCFKQEQLYNRFGYAVVNLHGAECFQ